MGRSIGATCGCLNASRQRSLRERLNNPQFAKEILPILTRRVGLLVVDKVHCISDWGHDFRPDYRRLSKVMDLLPRGVSIVAPTCS